MSDVIVRLDREDVSKIISGVVKGIARELRVEYRTLLAAIRGDGQPGQGIQVLSVSEVAKSLGKTPRQLEGLERRGELPRRRRISGRRVGYLAHEVEGSLSGERVKVRDERRLTVEELSKKVGLARRTIERMAEKGDLPPAVDGHWYERDVDEWLLGRPQVRD